MFIVGLQGTLQRPMAFQLVHRPKTLRFGSENHPVLQRHNDLAQLLSSTLEVHIKVDLAHRM